MIAFGIKLFTIGLMAYDSNNLPPLEGELSRRDLLRHLIAGNVEGAVVAYGTFDRYEFEQFEGPGALGRAVIARCVEINDGVPAAERELGTDISFIPLDDDASEEELDDDSNDEEDEDPDFAPDFLPLTVEDAEHLLANMPEQFLDQTTMQE